MAKFNVGDVTVETGCARTKERTITAVGTKNYLYTTNTVWDEEAEYSYAQEYADAEWTLKPHVPKPGDWWAHGFTGERFKVLEYGDKYVVARTFGTNNRVAFPRSDWDTAFNYHDWGQVED